MDTDREPIAYFVRELLIFFAFVLLVMPFAAISQDAAGFFGATAGAAYCTFIVGRVLCHVLAFMLDSWEMTNNTFMQRYAAYLYRFHWIFRPLYRLFGVPVPYAELGSAYHSSRTQEREQSRQSQHSGPNSYEREETEEQRYERRKRERAQQARDNAHQGQGSYGGESNHHSSHQSHSGPADDEMYERDGKMYDRQGNELTWFFTALGVSYKCTYEEAERAYRNLARQYHPDKVAQMGPRIRETAEKEMKEINRAWDECKRYFELANQRR